jgi:prepilin-type N-terminal cleavage/methylation domain-containing protein
MFAVPFSPSCSGVRSPRKNRAHGYTLVELMVSTTLGGIILVGVLTCSLFLLRSHLRMRNYGDLEVAARTALEKFAQDTRQSSRADWSSANEVALLVDGTTVIYAYDSANKRLTRKRGAATAEVLITSITTFSFSAYNQAGVNLFTGNDLGTSAGRAAVTANTKQIQISLRSAKSAVGTADSTNFVLSARYTLRNKKTTV